MRKFRKMYLSVGAICLASAISMSGVSAMKPSQKPSKEASAEQSSSVVETSPELLRLQTELSEWRERFRQQTEELNQTKIKLAIAQEKIERLKRLLCPPQMVELQRRIEELQALVAMQERQLEEARETIAQKDALINHLKDENERVQGYVNSANGSDGIIFERESVDIELEEVDGSGARKNREELNLLGLMDSRLRELDRAKSEAEIRAETAESLIDAAQSRAEKAESRVEELERQLKEVQTQLTAQAEQIESLSGTKKETDSAFEVTADASQAKEIITELERKIEEKGRLIDMYEQKILDLQVELQESRQFIGGMLEEKGLETAESDITRQLKEKQEELSQAKETIGELERKLENITRQYKISQQYNEELESVLQQVCGSVIEHYC